MYIISIILISRLRNRHKYPNSLENNILVNKAWIYITIVNKRINNAFY